MICVFKKLNWEKKKELIAEFYAHTALACSVSGLGLFLDELIPDNVTDHADGDCTDDLFAGAVAIQETGF